MKSDSPINSKAYWQERFFTGDWEKCGGEEQTTFFAQLAVDALPNWLCTELEAVQCTITDMGCAEGDGAAVWAHRFPNCLVSGVDFSSAAVEIASAKHPNCTFRIGDITGEIPSADVIFCSNVLEHLEKPMQIMERLLNAAHRHAVIMLPLHDHFEIQEHIQCFSEESFPLNMGRHHLSYFHIIDCEQRQITYWPGEQILLVYSDNALYPSQGLNLLDLFDNSEYVALKEMCRKNIAQLVEEKHQLETEKARIESEIIYLESDMTRLEAEKSQVEAEKTCLEAETSRLEAEKDCLEAEKVCLEMALSQMENEKDNLKKENEHQAKELARQEAERKLLEERKTQLENEISSLQEMRQKALFQLQAMIKSKLGKLMHFLYRLRKQGFHEDAEERKAFRKWFFARLLHKPTEMANDHRYNPLFSLINIIENETAQNPEFVQNVPALYQKNFPNIFIFAGVPVYDVGGGQRSAQLARIFNQMGYRVHYIYGIPCTESAPANVFIPAITHESIDHVSVEWFLKTVSAGDMAIFEIPFDRFEPYLDAAIDKKCHTIYEHIDNWDTSLGCLFYNKEVFVRFLEKAHTLTVTAKNLGEKIREYTNREYLYVANAVNSELFEPRRTYQCPDDLKQGKRTLLYFGSLWGEWFDWEKIEYVATHCHGVSINLIGDDAGCSDRKKTLPPNVHFLGIKKQTELPAYLSHSDIALLPFKKCNIGKYVSPLKIFEYIAMNVPVLATGLDDIVGYPNVICCDTKEEWANVINAPLPSLVDTSIFIASNNWYARCGMLLGEAHMLRVQYPKVSIIILNRNNMNVIFRCVDTLLAYQDHYGYEIIVVDNDSTDGSPEKLERQYCGKITLLRNGKNGCSSGRNLGVAHATGEYVCFLDSDQWVIGEQWLDIELAILESNNRIGAVGWAAGWFVPNQIYGPISDYYENRAIQNPLRLYRDDVAYLGSGGLLMRTSLFLSVGGFDEYYDPTCFEDTDLSLKIRNAGYELAYTPYSAIMHLPHQTTKSGSAKHAELMKRNGAYFTEKWERENPNLLKYYYKELD